MSIENLSSFSKLWRGLMVAAIALALDQATKYWILQTIPSLGSSIPLTSFFELVLVKNRGVSFGLFSQFHLDLSLAFSLFAILVSGVMLVWISRAKTAWILYGLGFIVGGAIGNMLDRLLLSSVVDFLHFHYKNFSFPAFNIADAAITGGVILMFIDGWIEFKGVEK